MNGAPRSCVNSAELPEIEAVLREGLSILPWCDIKLQFWICSCQSEGFFLMGFFFFVTD